MDPKKRRKGKNQDSQLDPSQPAPFELEVCKHLYRKAPSYEGKLAGCRVTFFTAKEAVTTLLSSRWAQPQEKDKEHKTTQFSNEETVARFMDKLLQKNLIGR